MTTLAALGGQMTDYLTAAGIPAVTAWPQQARPERTGPVAVVQVKEVETTGAGFQNYLGQQYDDESRQWTERYGQRVTVKFLLTLYSPKAAGEAGCRALLDQVAAALLQGGPAGFPVEKWSVGETAFDQRSGMFWGKLQAVCRGMLVAVTEESGALVGVEVKGEVIV